MQAALSKGSKRKADGGRLALCFGDARPTVQYNAVNHALLVFCFVVRGQVHVVSFSGR